ncbi:sirohydrochlorin chelatase [Aquibacillus rhizosphaerae]|uniref:Sirohydrochlorin chelatase n=1 Tax=Aquibacillus rhizosphaerae TaxID=3051431 RepID=A0ABT7L9Y8_9BACI|nr:sirohydrochlorin chelatase [Aquibacillus sp. LR5S19]MDL4842686.1 sirohydrochlorin chelatase [Aquibacillus sp. LR5S19]
MQGLLYISHGTRLAEGKQEAIDFLRSIQPSVNAPLQEICFLEICSPSIEEGVEQLVNRGATAISVVPVLLLSAKHDQEDIPMELNEVRKNHPEIPFSYGRPLGVQNRLIDILEDRVEQSLRELDQDAPVLLVGRGSFELSVQTDITSIANELGGRINRKVDVSYLAACKPSFDEALVQMEENKRKSGTIVPYLWFDGLLIQSMKKKINKYNQDNDAHIKLCHQLGDHPHMKQALIERANESFEFVLEGIKEH